ncbi:hypothetical protein [Endozoicomonas numazuensis]|uniref:Uncharacterized protein n=1 Tax=Endozoicomonas numazuensis TaxID=1137799 RepID=A0A081NL54_9GAMM|nr:hypothetical protein [Endozoicomonas numazuensis]KEQ19177.1 hypothetical protein GZ78_04055 [Endozoicomonas numazuensis]
MTESTELPYQAPPGEKLGPLEKAFNLLAAKPWSEDVGDQLERLEKQAKGRDKELFGDVWESYIVQGGE